jgi:uncharacterized protein (TIGR02145 family)
MAEGENKKNWTLEVITVIAICLFLWWKYRKKIAVSPEPEIIPESTNPNPLLDPYRDAPLICDEIMNKPLAPFDIQQGGYLNVPVGTCLRGDGSMYADSPNGYGSAYMEQQAEEYSVKKQEETVLNLNRKTITFRLINSTAVKAPVQVLDTTQQVAPFDPIPVIITDADGNVYTSIIIGTQQWLIENLKTTKYNDGTAIPNIILAADWILDTSGGYCWYDNDIANIDYGALYNWYAVNNAKGIAPTRFRIPSLADFNTLIAALGGTSVAGGKLKEMGLSHWLTPNTGATDEIGFKAFGAGFRSFLTGLFSFINSRSGFWTSTDIGATVMTPSLYYDGTNFSITTGSQYKAGCSIRCMKDI